MWSALTAASPHARISSHRNIIDPALWLEDGGGYQDGPSGTSSSAFFRSQPEPAIISERRKVKYVSIGDDTEAFGTVENARQYVSDLLGSGENREAQNT